MKLWIVRPVERSDTFVIVRAETKEEALKIARESRQLDYQEHEAFELSADGPSGLIEWWIKD